MMRIVRMAAIGFCMVWGLAEKVQASVWDDCFFSLRPIDFNKDGVMQTGELVDWVHGGDLSKNQFPLSGASGMNNNTIATGAISTRFFTGQTQTFHTMTRVDQEGSTTICSHGGANVYGGVAPYRDDSKEFSLVCRVRCTDVKKNTSWIFCAGNFSVGFNNNVVRIYSNGEAFSSSSADKIPVKNAEWIDLAVTFWQEEGSIAGVSCTTGHAHVVASSLSLGTDAVPFVTAEAQVHPQSFTSTGAWRYGTEADHTGFNDFKGKPKFFEGDIQHITFWNRRLSDEEILDAFKSPAPGVKVDGSYSLGAQNASGAEFKGREDADAAASFALDDAWRDLPAAMHAGDVWTLSVPLAADNAALMRRLTLATLETSAAGATFSAALNENDPVSAENDAVSFDFPRSQFREGDNTIVLTRTDSGAGPVLVDALTLAVVKATNLVAYTETTTDAADRQLSSMPDIVNVFHVPSGVMVTYTGLISGDGAFVKTGDGTLVLANAANTFAGGVTVAGGTLATLVRDAVTTPFGTGDVTVDQDAGAKLEISTSLANALNFTGASTRAAPALHFGAKATLSGAVSADTLYFSTAWADHPELRDELLVNFNNTVHADILGCAPHCTVRFGAVVTANVVDAYHVDNSAHVSAALCPTRGNLGRIGFSVQSNPINTLKIDQTRVITWKSGALLNTTIVFTGEHLADGWGCFDTNNTEQKNLIAANAPAEAVTEGGAQIINTGADQKSIIFTGNTEDDQLNVRFEGPMTLQFSPPKQTREITWAARRHLLSGRLYISRAMRFSEGCEFPNLTSIYSDSGTTVHFEEMKDGAFPNVTSVGSASSFSYYLRGGLFSRRAVNLLLSGKNNSTGKSSDALYVTDGKPWEVKGLTYGTVAGGEFHTVTAMAGDYSADDNPKIVDALMQGTLKVFTPCEVSKITYVGDGSSFTAASDWQDEGGAALAAAPDFTLPKYDAVIPLNGNTITLSAGETLFNNVQFTGGGTINGAADSLLEVFGTFKVDEAIDAGTDYTLNVPLRINQNTEIVIPTNGTFTSNIGISGTGNLELQGRAQSGRTIGSSRGGGWDLPQGGVFHLNGTNTLTGKLLSKRGVVYLRGVLGTEHDGSTLEHDCSTGGEPYLYGVLVYDGVTVNKTVKYSSAGMGQQVSNRFSCVQLGVGSTNVFNRPYTFSASNYLYLFDGCKVVFNDSYTCDNSQSFISYANTESAEVVFEGPVKVPSTAKGYLIFNGSAGNGETVFRLNGADGVVGMYLQITAKAHVYCGADNVLVPTTYFLLERGGVLDLGDSRFTVPSIKVDGGARVIGEAGSCLEVTDATYVAGTGDKRVSYNTFNGSLEGAASLQMSGPAATLKYGGTGLSTGSLAVSDGTLEMTAAASFNPEGSVAFEGDGVISLPAGKRLKVTKGSLNNQPLANGLYTTAAPGALEGRITGGGSVRIGVKSLVINLR